MKLIKSKKILIILMIVALSIPIITYAVDGINENENKEFFEVDKTEAEPGETIIMSINTEYIPFDEFEFSLNSNKNLDNIDIQENIETEIEENQVKLTANKQEINKITLYYKIPEDIQIGTEIELTAKAKEINNTEEIETEPTETENTSSEELEIKINIKIVEKDDSKEENDEQEKSEEDKEKLDNEEKDENNQKNPENQQIQNTSNSQNKLNIKSNESETNNIVTNTKEINSKGTNLSEENQAETYNGESNNYLSSLILENYDINPEFSKTNTTYFLTVNNDVENINIEAIAESEEAKINIYGNENLETGKNKILITVTAENGDVKTYRIYVEKES